MEFYSAIKSKAFLVMVDFVNYSYVMQHYYTSHQHLRQWNTMKIPRQQCEDVREQSTCITYHVKKQ